VGRGLPGDGTELGALDGRGEKRGRYMAWPPQLIDPDSFGRVATDRGGDPETSALAASRYFPRSRIN